ncbi:lipid-A-disaccharide synthase [Echinicola pacifica]|uniref:Lipid-A-disaccharide synthase n=1 Tax=Echinicola pacifica TaxID=346377 RepID=A0A918QA35_9BACT|nr:lipid-A-disaccharide synthase [Echinicola pacifica]GGZ39520.1 lipid-A-disaccharide synthase [Echinicola pacifica]
MKYYVIAGERSGDMHLANLVKALKEKDPDADFRGMAGDYSAAEGVSLVSHYKEVAVMGFVEVLFGFRKVLSSLKMVKEDLAHYKPDALILVDYGGFNMKIAKFAKESDFVVHYYIPPKVWAWNQKRAYKLKKNVDYLYSILPFEKTFFQKFDWEINYVGNPLFDEIRKFEAHDFFHQKNELSYKPIVALLPGSRKQEVENMLDEMVVLISQFPQFQFVIAGVKNLSDTIYDKATAHGVKVIYDQTYDLLHYANAAVVTSGTATLETALFNVPQVVVYKTSAISYAIAKNLIKVPYISLVNLIAEKEVVTELIQDDYNSDRLNAELTALFESTGKKNKMLEGYKSIKSKLGELKASEETARLIMESFESKKSRP